MEKWIPVRRVAAKVLNKQSLSADRGSPPAWGLGEVVTTSHHKNGPCFETDTCASGLNWSFGIP